jgi:hypothetical protein
VTTFYDDLSGFGSWAPVHPHNNPFALGPEVTLSDSGMLSPMHASIGRGGHGGGGGGTGGGTAPIPTPVANGNLTIDLIWDTNIANAGTTVETNFMNTVTAAAKALVNALGPSTAHKETVYVDIGWGEVAGQALVPGALGESSTNGYLVSEATVASLLLGSGDTLGGSNPLSSTTQFFLPTAEAKALGLTGASAGSVSSPDGYIGFGSSYSWEFTDSTGTPTAPIAANQYSLYGVALHEISEAMGRIGMEGLSTFNGAKTYTPLDLFNYSLTTAGALSLSNSGGYFSANGGGKASGVFNNSSKYGGDIADWASATSPTAAQTTVPAGNYEDAFNAFGYPGYNDVLSTEDILLMQTLGY